MNIKDLNLKQKKKLSISLYKEGKFSEAKMMFYDINNEEPKNYITLLHLGKIELLSNNLENAEKLLTKASNLKPKRKEPKHYLGELYYRLKNYVKASGFYRVTGREVIAKKLSSFGDSIPYDINGEHEISKIKFITSEPLPVVQVKVNGSDLANFIVDTGGAEIILDEQFAQELGVKNFGKEKGTFAGGKTALFQHGKVDSIKIGDFNVRNVPIQIMNIRPISDIYFNGLQLDGVIGTIFLYQFLASIDYINDQLILRCKNQHNIYEFEKELENGKNIVVPFWMVESHFMVAWGKINNSNPLLFFIDTGLVGGGFIPPKSTIKKGNISLEKQQTREYVGGGGKTEGIPFEIEELSLGAITEKNIQGIYFDNFPFENCFGFHIGGLISHEFFKNYTFTIDFTKMRYFLRKK